MFQNEARLAAALRDPHIAQVYDFGEEDGAWWMALELVEGTDLRTLLEGLRARGQPMPRDLALVVLGDLCQALAFAHERVVDGVRGVVHRDVTPSNVLLSYEGAVKLTDFGIARALDATGEGVTTSSVRGKVPYMAPEQALAGEVDARVDLFALGVLAYEMFAGRRPFDGPTDLATMSNIVAGAHTPLHEAAPDVAPALADAIERLLAPRKEERFPSAAALLEALAALPAPPLDARRRLGALVRAIAPPPDDDAVARPPTTPTASRTAAGADRAAPRTAQAPSSAAEAQAAPLPVARTKTSSAGAPPASPNPAEDSDPHAAPAAPARAAPPSPGPPASSPASAVPLSAAADVKAAAAEAPPSATPGRSSPPPSSPRSLHTAPPSRRALRRWVPVLAVLLPVALAGGAWLALGVVASGPRAPRPGTAVDAPHRGPRPASAPDPGTPSAGEGPGPPTESLPASSAVTPPALGTRVRDTAPPAPEPRAPDPFRSDRPDSPASSLSSSSPSSTPASPDAPQGQTRDDARATLTITAYPWGFIEVDGRPLGRSPQRATLDPGPHVVTVRAEQAVKRRRITLAPGERRDLLISIE
jgi:serine/threonine-protein kinase